MNKVICIEVECSTNAKGITFAECIVNIDHTPYASYFHSFGKESFYQMVDNVHIISNVDSDVIGAYTDEQLIKLCLDKHNQKDLYLKYLLSKPMLKDIQNCHLVKPLVVSDEINNSIFVECTAGDRYHISVDFLYAVDGVF